MAHAEWIHARTGCELVCVTNKELATLSHLQLHETAVQNHLLLTCGSLIPESGNYRSYWKLFTAEFCNQLRYFHTVNQCARSRMHGVSCCGFISTSTGADIPWVDEIRYLGIFIVRSRKFKCSLDYAKRSYYRAANAILVRLDDMHPKM